MNAQRARRRRRDAARAREAARRRRLATVVALVVVVVVAGALAVSAAGRSRHAAAAGQDTLPGLQTGPAPWGANTADLAARLRAVDVPPLSPFEGTPVHIHQHLDLYVDGHRVPVPAGIGIDPAVGYAPLHTHDASGVIHVESPTVRRYTLGEFFAVWGVRFTLSCLGGYCAGGDRRLRVYVDGAAYRGDPTTLTLESHQELVVAFGTAAQLPSPIPSTYQFPPANSGWPVGPAPSARPRARWGGLRPGRDPG
jgi:hypothetical protein